MSRLIPDPHKAGTHPSSIRLKRIVQIGGTVLAILAFTVIWKFTRHIQVANNQRDHQKEEAASLREGLSALRSGNLSLSRAYLRQLETGVSSIALEGRCALGDLEFRAGNIVQAELQYSEVVRIDPDHYQAHDRLGQVLALEGRASEAAPHLSWGLKQLQYPFEQLLITGRPESLLNESMRQQVEGWSQSGLNASRRQLALAILELNADRFDQAELLLQSSVRIDPGLLEAQSKLGWRLVQLKDSRRFVEWHQTLSQPEFTHPGMWTVQAEWLRSRGDFRGAVGYYLESIARDPNQRIPVYQAGHLLTQLGDKVAAQPFLDRVRSLDDLQVALEAVANDRGNRDRIEQAARATESLGRLWEAQGWYGYLASLTRSPEVMEHLSRIRSRIKPDLPQTTPESNPSTLALRRRYPCPSIRAEEDSKSVEFAAKTNVTPSAIRFTNSSEAMGIQFRYFNDHDPTQVAMRIQESIGGGALVIDFDQDGWPDLHATQGCRWPPSAARTDHLDRLFRNQQGQRFIDTTAEARIEEWGYSQGGAVGDFDNDGFPDLYIGNIGPNRFYHNNGDGTFTDVTSIAEVSGNEWTTSCAMCDVNSDGLPDLYAVGYLGGDQVYGLICHDENGIPRSCKPNVHPPAIDRLFINLGDGRFHDASESVAPTAGGRGLGIVIADFCGSGLPDLFIANDAEPNFFFVNEKTSSGCQPRFSEQAMSLGLALDRNGRPQASMGVAAGDADGNHFLDLFVTNYYHEGGTLYLQSQPHLFGDETRTAGLFEPTFPMLGFGTQFLDANLDGNPDLVIGNGHEGNLTDLGIPYQMSPQFFISQGTGQFAELPGAELGDYFQGKYLARGLSRLDWNLDGKPDFAVSHLDAPLALVTNETPTVGNWVSITLRGTVSSRDAIGAIVEAETDKGQSWHQSVGGDGFHASNDRRIILGLGTAAAVKKLSIRWPSGKFEQFTVNLETGTNWSCIEGYAPVKCPIIRSDLK